MKIFLAWGGLNTYTYKYDVLYRETDNILVSYFYRDDKENKLALDYFYHHPDMNKSIIYDSGAFTVFNNNQPDIDIYQFCDWGIEEKKRWRGRIGSLEIMTLDVIGDQEKTIRNTDYLFARGLNPIAIITSNATDKQIEEILDKYNYIAVGGLTGLANRDKKLDLVRRVFKHWFPHYKRGRKIKIHLLGVGSKEVFEKYPAYSADMTSWYLGLAGYGRAHFMNRTLYGDLQKIPPYTNKEPATIGILNYCTIQYIKHFKNMSEYMTKLWESRGLICDE